MNTWRYVQNGQPCGPVETTALQSLITTGALTPDTLVWKEGMANWAPARTFPEFASAAPPGGAPPLPSAAGVPPPPSTPPLTDAEDIDKNKIFAVLAYIGLLFLVPLLAAPQSRFARYHTNQGVVLFLSSLVAFFASIVLVFFPLVGCVALPLPYLVAVCSLVFMIIGIINAASGQYKPLPLIGHFELIK